MGCHACKGLFFCLILSPMKSPFRFQPLLSLLYSLKNYWKHCYDHFNLTMKEEGVKKVVYMHKRNKVWVNSRANRCLLHSNPFRSAVLCDTNSGYSTLNSSKFFCLRRKTEDKAFEYAFHPELPKCRRCEPFSLEARFSKCSLKYSLKKIGQPIDRS